MKKIWKVLGITAILLIATATVVFACSYSITLGKLHPSCEYLKVTDSVESSDSGQKLKIEIYLDGSLIDSKEGTSNANQSTIKATIDQVVTVGSHTITTVGYKKDGNGNNSHWVEFARRSRSVSIVSCYVPCSVTNTDIGEWSEWQVSSVTYGAWVDTGVNFKRVVRTSYIRTRTISELDSVDASVCSSEIKTEYRGLIEFEYKDYDPVYGCTDQLANNFDPKADTDDESCAYDMCEWNEELLASDPLCVEPVVNLGCAFTMYVLQGNGTCSLTRNYGLEDIPGKIPSRFVQDGKLTAYGQGLCNQCRTTPFKYSGEWTTACDIPCVDCN